MISSKTVIAKAIADFNLLEDLIRISDWKEWLLEGMLKIGAILLFEHKVEILPIECHQVSLPCDLYKLDLVAYSYCCNGGWLPMRKATSSFGVSHDNQCCSKACMLVQDVAMFPLVKNMFNLTNDREALDKLNEDNNLRETLSVLINLNTVPTANGRYLGNRIGHKDGTMYSYDLLYMTKPGYIMTNVPRGYIKISYYAIYTDEDSMPMIPDLESYKEALLWYLGVKHFYPLKLKGLISQSDYYDMRNSWNFYRKLAYAEAMSPGPDEIESIKNTWHKLYPEMNDHDTFFSTSGEEQILYNQDSALRLI
ncbi:tail tubular protein [uncultured phage cr53_1]|uniref:Tail tubular protein n=3 Tax=Crassvirales TaxID=1978007 RepID=A0A7M1RS71_9CAUD|nr:tail tubular protein [uncultured phage cr53_1]QOR56761.1 tail tubular protein [uncultured phage cr53_1]